LAGGSKGHEAIDLFGQKPSSDGGCTFNFDFIFTDSIRQFMALRCHNTNIDLLCKFQRPPKNGNTNQIILQLNRIGDNHSRVATTFLDGSFYKKNRRLKAFADNNVNYTAVMKCVEDIKKLLAPYSHGESQQHMDLEDDAQIHASNTTDTSVDTADSSDYGSDADDEGYGASSPRRKRRRVCSKYYGPSTIEKKARKLGRKLINRTNSFISEHVRDTRDGRSGSGNAIAILGLQRALEHFQKLEGVPLRTSPSTAEEIVKSIKHFVHAVLNYGVGKRRYQRISVDIILSVVSKACGCFLGNIANRKISN